MRTLNLKTALGRGLVGRCPTCGKGKLFRAYLKAKPCDVCGHDNAVYPADDGPAYFTILLVGHAVIAPVLLFDWIWTKPAWVVVGTVVPALVVLCMALLPRIKGAFIGVMTVVGMTRSPSQ